VDFTLEDGKAVLRHTPEVLRSMLPALPPAWLDADEGPGTWSPWMVMGHLLHIEESDWMDRVELILDHDDVREFEPIDREAGFTRFAGLDIDDLVARFGATRRANLEALDASVTEVLLERTARHPDFGPVTLRQLLAAWVVHDLNHLGQIVKTMAKQYRDAVGPWREYLPIIDAP
jgi:uncharacterized damage-inducible protein DinB